MRRRLLSAGGSGIPLSNLPQGALIGLNEGGAVKPFLLAAADYPATGRTLLLRKWLCDTLTVWNSYGTATYASSTIDAWLTGSYLSVFDAATQALITPVDIKYTARSGVTTVSTLSRRIFLLSATEAGSVSPSYNVEGIDTGLFPGHASRVAYAESTPTTPRYWYGRSPYAGGNSSYQNYVFAVSDAGGNSLVQCNSSFTPRHYTRPALTLPGNLMMNPTPTPEGYYIPV